VNIVKGVRNTLVLGYMLGALWIIRTPVTLFFSLITAFSLSFLVVAIEGLRGSLPAIVGGLVSVAVSSGMTAGSDATNYRLNYRFQDIIVASPVTRTEYVAGLGVAQLLFHSPGLLVYLTLLYMLFRPALRSLALIVLVVLVTWLFSSSLGFFYSSYAPNVRHAGQLAGVISSALVVLPPVYYPASLLPKILVRISQLVPTVDASELIRGVLTGSAWQYSMWIILLVYTTTFYTLTAKKAKWRQD
jgi:ABC-type polysaccharide/polyol phosphate export systems, permease component